MRATPYLLSLPALLLFAGVVVVPLVMTIMLTFHDWGQYKGIEPVFILKNWREIATDPYYAEMFGRTFRIAILTTLLTAVLGAPEAYILNRMGGRWKSFFLLVILGPLLISVVARTLGCALWGLETALVTDGDARYLFVEVAPRTFERRAVTVAPLAPPGSAAPPGGRVVVRTGLASGERVVIRGAFTLKSELAKAALAEDEH